MESGSTTSFVRLDGSIGEGGGQILRSALALSMATGKPFRIEKIRASRARPGLMRQHLACVLAAAQICKASVKGAQLGSDRLAFSPGRVRSGEYAFTIGTAGSTTLVLQAIMPALLIADGPSRVIVEGGTHNKAAPCFEFLTHTLVPIMQRTGVKINLMLERHGFYPAGGGRVVVEIEPVHRNRALLLELMERGAAISCRAVALVSALHESIGEREAAVLRDRLGLRRDEVRVFMVPSPVGPGNAAYVKLEFAHITEVVTGFGERGKSAEQVAHALAEEALAYLDSTAPVGEHLADQLMVPLALLAGGRYAAASISEHTRTNLEVLRAFGVDAVIASDGVVSVAPIPGTL